MPNQFYEDGICEFTDDVVHLLNCLCPVEKVECCIDGEPGVAIVIQVEGKAAPALVTVTPGMMITDNEGKDIDFKALFKKKSTHVRNSSKGSTMGSN
jgi:hypothetical protein